MIERHRATISSSAASQLIGANLPSPFLPMRRSGVVNRSGECTISASRLTLAQAKPAVKGWSGSPLMRFTRPSSTSANSEHISGQSCAQTIRTVSMRRFCHSESRDAISIQESPRRHGGHGDFLPNQSRIPGESRDPPGNRMRGSWMDPGFRRECRLSYLRVLRVSVVDMTASGTGGTENFYQAKSHSRRKPGPHQATARAVVGWIPAFAGNAVVSYLRVPCVSVVSYDRQRPPGERHDRSARKHRKRHYHADPQPPGAAQCAVAGDDGGALGGAGASLHR